MKYKDTISYQLLKIRKVDFYLNGIEKGVEKGRVSPVAQRQKKKKKKSACNAGAPGDASSIPGSGRSPGGGNGNPLQYSCLDNPMDRPRGHQKSDITETLTFFTFIYM